MFGSFAGTDAQRWPNRRLGIEAALGFHAPYLEGGDVPDPNAAYNVNFQQGVRAIGTFLTTLYQTKASTADRSQFTIDRKSLDAFFAPELMAAMISKGPDEAFVIRTLDDAGMWDIDLITSDPSATLNSQNVFQACNSARSWRAHEHASVVSPADMIASPGDEPIIRHDGNKTRALLTGFIGLTGEACAVEQFALSDGRMHVDVRIVGKDYAEVTLERNVPWTPQEIAWASGYDKSWYLLPPTNVICSDSCARIREIPTH